MAGATRRRGGVRVRDWGRFSAFVLCVAFAVVGAVPLALGLLVRTEAVQAWAARETAALLLQKLGITARYEVRVQAWPLTIGLNDLVVYASDGGPPFLELERVAVRPRLFSLLAGRLDAGDVELIAPRIRAVVKDGALQNLALPKSDGSSGGGPFEAPLSSVAITDARIDLTIEDVHIDAREVDLDVSAEEGNVLELALRAGRLSSVRTHKLPGREATEDSVEEDVICRFDTRVRLEPDRVLVRRLTLHGSADLDPDPGTAPPCALPDGDWRRVELELGAFRIVGLSGFPSKIGGRVHARLPLPLVHRVVDLPPVSGAVSLDVEADYDVETASAKSTEAPAVLRLPVVQGTLKLDQPGLEGRVFATRFAADVSTTADEIRLANADVAWADGKVRISRAELKPFEKGVKLQVGPVDIDGIELPGLLRDLAVHPRAHVAWTLREGRFDHFGGTLAPLALDGPLTVHTRGFEVFDRPTTDPARQHMMGVKEATVHGTFSVRPRAIVLSGFAIDTPRSHLGANVSLGFDDDLAADISAGSRVDLADISPISSLELAGVATLKAALRGSYGHPGIKGEVAIERFVLAGFPLGDLEPSPVAFEPLVVTMEDARLKHGASRVRLPSLRVDFDTAATVALDASVDTREAPHLQLKDLLEVLRLDKDPRYQGYAAVASGTGRAHFALGGPEDRCGGGLLDVRSSMHVSDVTLLGETYDDGEIDVDLLWDDQAAGADGMRLDVRSASLRKKTGTVLASASVRHGGVLKGNVIASGIPLERLDMLAPVGKLFDGSVSMVASLGGTMSRLEGLADLHVSRVRIGPPPNLPPSHVELAILPLDVPPRVIGTTACGNPQTAPFNPAEFERDVSDGVFIANGSLFGGQVVLDNVRMTRQRRAVVSGKVRVDAQNLGPFGNLIPGVAYVSAPPTGAVSASLDIERLPLADPRQAAATLGLDALALEWQGRQLRLRNPSGPIRLADNALQLPVLDLEARTSGLATVFTAGGRIQKVFSTPELDVDMKLDRTDLSQLSKEIPQIRRAGGTVEASVKVTGPLSALRYAGSASLKQGELDVEGLPVSLDDVDVEIAIGDGKVRLMQATAKVGAGKLSARGSMPVRGLELGMAEAQIVARKVKLPVADGVDLTADADLKATFWPGLGASDDESGKNLPFVDGKVTLTSFNYTRPIVMSVDLGQLTSRQRTSVNTYDPAADVVRFRLNVVAPGALRFSNNLADMKLEASPAGLTLSGTNQRFGAQGTLRIQSGSKLMLRSTEFNVRQGYVRFEDPYRITPKVDLQAETEFRRYASSSPSSSESPSGADTAALAGASRTGGLWRIKLHAQGDADNLRLNLSSDPPLGQEDIVLLLTLGMTRAEIDQGLAASLGETVGLEALSTLTGADKAVKTIVPLIDEFRFGTGYSSRSGRTEPAVTVGKRITDKVRANVTTSLSESRDVRAGVEVKITDRMSVQGSYDNANEGARSSFGNLGADLRWRLEFE
jgi:translocation and assembly module TamB